MHKSLKGMYSVALAGALTLAIIPLGSDASKEYTYAATEASNTITAEDIQTFTAPATVSVEPLERSSYSATTPEELAKIKEEREAKEKAEEEKKKAEEEAKLAAEAEARAAQGQAASATLPLYSGGGSKEEWLTSAGIAESDWAYVDYIVNHESGWNPNAVNASSGASGLVQALPCGKVPGSCFNPVDNLKWADSYAKGRYGSWEGAYNFWVSNNWW